MASARLNRRSGVSAAVPLKDEALSLPSVPVLPGLQDVDSPLAGYIRVSRIGDRSGESYISPDIQQQSIHQWAKQRKANVVFFPPEENVSGGTMDRPIFNEVLAKITSGELGGIVVYTYDRFARTMIGGLTTVEKLLAVDATFASATEPQYDLTTAIGKQMFQMQLMNAEYFRNRIKEVWRTSAAYAINRGVHISPSVAYGYSKDENKRLIPNEAAPFVLKSYEKRVEGWTYQAIADWLNTNAPARMVKVIGRREYEAVPFTAATVQEMLSRKVYLGIAHWGDQVNLTAHEAIVSLELWEKAQQRVGTHARRHGGEDIALLHGIVRCAGCLFGMSRALNTSRDRERYYYRCRCKRRSGTCEAPAAVRADGDDGLDLYVERIVCAELDRRHSTYEGVEDHEALDAVLVELEEAREDLDAFKADTRARRLLGDGWADTLELYVSAVRDAEARVAELRVSTEEGLSGLTSAAYLSLSRPERAKVLTLMIDAVMLRNVGGSRGRYAVALDNNRVLILWKGCGPTDLPAPGRKADLIPFDWPVVEDEAPTVMPCV